MNTLPLSTEVVIIGARMAGLSAARALDRAGVQVTVLEARGRAGGRIHSLDAHGGAIELGATWFWANEPLVQSLLQEYQLPIYRQDEVGETLVIQRSGQAFRVPRDPLAGPSLRVAGGMSTLPDALANSLSPGVLFLDTAVARVRLDGPSVVVEAASGSIAADHVIVALPPSLAVDAIDFAPPLPASLQLLARQTAVWMGGIVKAVAIYDRPFWRERGLSGFIFSEAGPINEFHDHSTEDGRTSAIFGFASADAIGSGDQETVREVLIEQLTGIFGADAATPVNVVSTNWSSERYTSPPHGPGDASTGTYGHPAYQTSNLDARIHWASTETAEAYAGHIEGAIRAGLAAASAVISSPR